jgi:hypothetical protein
MSPTRESVVQAVLELPEEEARKALAYIRSLHGGRGRGGLRARLAAHPAITLPTGDSSALPDLAPVQGTGIPASEILVRERR